MNTPRDLFDRITSGDIPVWALGGAGVVLSRIAMKVAKGSLESVFVTFAPAALVGTVCSHLHRQGRI